MSKTRNILEELAVAWRRHLVFQDDMKKCKNPVRSKALRKEAGANWDTITGLLDENAKE